jgi:hypothetical protein
MMAQKGALDSGATLAASAGFLGEEQTPGARGSSARQGSQPRTFCRPPPGRVIAQRVRAPECPPPSRGRRGLRPLVWGLGFGGLPVAPTEHCA